ncbi:MAG: Holliday junction ATP-dependent DNA helicase RuvA [Synergistaceae bacterium]|nr:Holliday junction ATP-dependent DNA helicase RuvA [Synergistaceae bacterium]
MINSLRGKVISIGEESITLEVSGFGLEIFSSRSLISQASLSEELFCFAYMQVSDAGISLFGFSNERERRLFIELLQVKTVGGKLAVTLLRHLNADQILQAISSGNSAILTVPGLGAKRAERICFELKNKISKKFSSIGSFGEETKNDSVSDSFVMEALTGLGFTQGEAISAISRSRANSASETLWTEEELLKASLSLLRRN